MFYTPKQVAELSLSRQVKRKIASETHLRRSAIETGTVPEFSLVFLAPANVSLAVATPNRNGRQCSDSGRSVVFLTKLRRFAHPGTNTTSARAAPPARRRLALRRCRRAPPPAGAAPRRQPGAPHGRRIPQRLAALRKLVRRRGQGSAARLGRDPRALPDGALGRAQTLDIATAPAGEGPRLLLESLEREKGSRPAQKAAR